MIILYDYYYLLKKFATPVIGKNKKRDNKCCPSSYVKLNIILLTAVAAAAVQTV